MRKTDGSAFTLSEIIEIMTDAVESRRITMMPREGMQVPYHGPLCNAPPSVVYDVEKWIKMLSYTVDQLEEQMEKLV